LAARVFGWNHHRDSGKHIRDQFVFKAGNLILELQLLFFKPLQFQLFESTIQ